MMKIPLIAIYIYNAFRLFRGIKGANICVLNKNISLFLYFQTNVPKKELVSIKNAKK